MLASASAASAQAQTNGCSDAPTPCRDPRPASCLPARCSRS
jgi:hypothetical protein